MKVADFLNDLDDDTRQVVEPLRKLALKVSGKCKEDVKWNALCLFNGDRAFVGIMPYRKYVSVIFDRGSELADPKGILEGDGKKMRHIKIFNKDEIKKKNVAYYVKQSFHLT